MFCPNCGNSVPDGAAACPNCGYAQPAPQPQPQQQSQPQQQTQPAPAPAQKPAKAKRGMSKSGKNFAAIFSALLVFPATISVATDLMFHKYDYWFGYVVGALLVIWVVAVLPMLRITPPPVTAIISFAAIVCYAIFVASKAGWLEKLKEFWMPLLILSAALIALASVLIGGKHVKGLHTLSLLAAEAAVFFICLEFLLDRQLTSAVELRWSLILACGFVSVIAVVEAVNFVLNNKDKN